MNPTACPQCGAHTLHRLLNPPGHFMMVGLDNPKTSANVGSALRAAHCFGAAAIIVRGHRYTRAGTDATKAWRHFPLICVESLAHALPYDCVPVAVDILDNAQSLPTYDHPRRAFYIFGAEDATLGQPILEWCRDIVSIPTAYCLNLAAAVNVVLYDRIAKQTQAMQEQMP